MLPQPSGGDTCWTWTWFKEPNMWTCNTFCDPQTWSWKCVQTIQCVLSFWYLLFGDETLTRHLLTRCVCARLSVQQKYGTMCLDAETNRQYFLIWFSNIKEKKYCALFSTKIHWKPVVQSITSRPWFRWWPGPNRWQVCIRTNADLV